MAIRIGTSERGGTFHGQGHALKKILERNPGFGRVETLESRSASIDNARRLGAAEIEFGFMASNWIGCAYNGEAPFASAIELAMVAPMNAGPLFFIVPAHSPIHTVADLQGRRIAIGLPTSGMVQHARCIFEAIGMSLADFSPIYLDFAGGAHALLSGEVDAQFQCPIPNAVMSDLDQRMALRVLPYHDRELETIMHAVPYYRRTVMRQGALRALDRDLPQLAVINVLVTRPRLADNMVREVVAAILENHDELARLDPLFTGMNELFEPLRTKGAAALEFGGVKLHPGALHAYRQAGMILGSQEG